ncbi:peptidoglycan-binding protein [Streptomyces sp. NPDC012450]|uniref:peptidoglycan-binding domain-containing protein n=1 Tax=Streptomyces sp. NPDC012450 TaxID=3364834 RepID=UPI0036E2F1EE
MRNRAAPTTAVTSATGGSAGAEHRGDRVFGKVAEPDRGETGARGQDIELFDATVRLPKVPAGDTAPAPASRRSRRARPAAPAWRSMPLPLMLAGALSAGLGAALAVWLSAEPDAVPASNPSVSLPVLATHVPPPAPDTASGAPPSAGAGAARTSRSASPPAGPSASGTPSPDPTTASPTDATSPGATSSSAAASAPAPTPSPSDRRHRPSHPDRDEDGRDEDGRDRDDRDRDGWDDRDGSGRDGVRRGSTGPDVVDLQRRLQRLQLYVGPADGVFGESVEVALRRYQVARNIPQENGVYGPLTRAVLRAETD